ncbi:hypothetical protein Moror_9729 [Moniliophthora roreri MCA 2997]|uniref:Uncharacterized protein n=1 Tax=Moniliophthora roreri (strain MCA 2997) TaxID=1381753 RepID=V2X2H0_MONRO|nr:hypothetical protein Moror_9729 [Moniliophthora roreri MCA 2997]
MPAASLKRSYKEGRRGWKKEGEEWWYRKGASSVPFTLNPTPRLSSAAAETLVLPSPHTIPSTPKSTPPTPTNGREMVQTHHTAASSVTEHE